MAPPKHSFKSVALLFAISCATPACTGSDDAGGNLAGGGTSGGAAGNGGNLTVGGMGGLGGTAGVGGVNVGGTAGVGGASVGGTAGIGGAGIGGAGIGGAAGNVGGNTTGAGGSGAGSGGNGGTGGGMGGSGGASTSPGCGTAPTFESGIHTIDVGGTNREYTLRLPDNYDMNHPHRIIFAFHARGGNMGQVAGGSNNDYYGLFSRSDDSAIFISPNGLDAGWRNTGGSDVEFVKAMLAAFEADLCVDRGRIFATGFSFGGMMSNAIGCAMADVFRAIAPMSGAIPNPDHLYSECNEVNDHPIAMWMAHGDNDQTVPYADGLDALNLFLERAECGTETVAVSPSPCVAYQGCLPDYPIHLCEFAGGHSVPAFAAEGIWAFFEQF